MGTRGYVGYRYKRKYYRQFIRWDAYPCDHGEGQRLANMVPREPSAFKDWVADRIHILENAKTNEIVDEYDHSNVIYPDDGVGADELGFDTTYDNDWTFPGNLIEWTYIFDLDNMTFTINGATHFRLDNMPPNLDFYEGDDIGIPKKYLRDTVDLWPVPNFDIEEQQCRYKALKPIVVPATEWSAPTWEELSVSQRFSIEIAHHWLHNTSDLFQHAYAPVIRSEVGKFGWDVLCASVPALPIFQEKDFKTLGLSPQTLSSGFHADRTRPPYCGRPPPERSEAEIDWSAEFNRRQELTLEAIRHPNKFLDNKSIKYFWVRGCLITFCVRLYEPIYVALEVEKMVKKMQLDGHTESVGVILSSQQELVVVAVDGSQVRHSPVLDIRATDGRPGRATDGRLLLTYLLSPPCTTSPLPWRAIQPLHPPDTHSSSIANLPPEILSAIVGSVDMNTYVSLCRVSKSFRAACVANPRIGEYTILHKIPGLETVFAARSTNNHAPQMIELRWKYVKADRYLKRGKWEIREVSPGDLDEMKREQTCE
ncbi:unnamed protein product [Rhizoctonia solani]|uniref:F-box domain-containing protein n=1 Tax=Rhizoctonia solani TaxID=456999 RepID=A0A8H3HUR9_9AGAM|nr:unnamed protein product [Rhizoctonia solani]